MRVCERETVVRVCLRACLCVREREIARAREREIVIQNICLHG